MNLCTGLQSSLLKHLSVNKKSYANQMKKFIIFKNTSSYFKLKEHLVTCEGDHQMA